MTDAFETEAALSILINLTGKMRMLSHRAVMAAMQETLMPENSADAQKTLDCAVEEFSEIAAAVHSGSAKLKIPADVAALLEAAGALRGEIQDPIKRFIAEAKQIGQAIHSNKSESAPLAHFSNFVAFDLLNALNKLNACVTETLQDQLEEQRKADEAAREVVLAAVQSISDVSMKVKLISLNASVEAARAGEHGRGFGVIAQEIRTLSEDAAKSTQQIAGHLKRMA